jgi:hypothetical protein
VESGDAGQYAATISQSATKCRSHNQALLPFRLGGGSSFRDGSGLRSSGRGRSGDDQLASSQRHAFFKGACKLRELLLAQLPFA